MLVTSFLFHKEIWNNNLKLNQDELIDMIFILKEYKKKLLLIYRVYS